jgi:hypothetical protein
LPLLLAVRSGSSKQDENMMVFWSVVYKFGHKEHPAAKLETRNVTDKRASGFDLCYVDTR